MQQEFVNHAVVSWARQALSQPIEVKLLFSSRLSRTILYLLLFGLAPLFFFYLKLSGNAQVGWIQIFFCSGVMLLPGLVVAAIGILARRKIVILLDKEGAVSGGGSRYFWKDLYYIDHRSRYRRTRKILDNQLNLVFADGVAIIPRPIHDRDKVWALVNSIPAEVRVDGKMVGQQ